MSLNRELLNTQLIFQYIDKGHAVFLGEYQENTIRCIIFTWEYYEYTFNASESIYNLIEFSDVKLYQNDKLIFEE